MFYVDEKETLNALFEKVLHGEDIADDPLVVDFVVAYVNAEWTRRRWRRRLEGWRFRDCVAVALGKLQRGLLEIAQERYANRQDSLPVSRAHWKLINALQRKKLELWMRVLVRGKLSEAEK